jgi:hypothetical protein
VTESWEVLEFWEGELTGYFGALASRSAGLLRKRIYPEAVGLKTQVSSTVGFRITDARLTENSVNSLPHCARRHKIT